MSDERREGRSPAEWTTFAASSLVLAVVIAMIVGQLLSTSDPALPRAELGSIERVGNRYRAHVAVTNDGDETAANVQVGAALTSDRGDETGDLSIDFLAGGETEQLVFMFDEDPSKGDLHIAVSGFQEP